MDIKERNYFLLPQILNVVVRVQINAETSCCRNTLIFMYYTDSVSGMCVISEGYFSTEYISVFANVPLISGSHSISFCSQ